MKLPLKIIFLLLLAAQISWGEELLLSLNRALELAEQNDLPLAIARLEVETGDATVREAVSAALPKITASTTAMRHMVIPTMYFPKIGFELPVIDDETSDTSYIPINFGGSRSPIGPPNDIATDITLQQPIWLAGKVGMALKAARLYRQIARDALTGSRARLKSDVIREYFGLVMVREVVKVTKESYLQATRHAETVERMFNVGMASEFDLLRAQVEVKSLEPQIALSEKNAELARLSLCNRLGINPEDSVVLTDKLGNDNDNPETAAYPEAFDAALGIRPEFKIFQLREDLEKISIKAESRNIYWPNLFFGLSYRRNAQENSFSDMSDVLWPETFTWTVNMQIPLFDGFATPAKVQKARIGLRKTMFERMQLEQGVRLEVSNAICELKRTHDQLNSFRAAMELAERASRIAQTRYEEGVGTELEVLDAQLSLHSAKLGHLQGLYDLRIARAEYARIVENDTDFGGGK